MTTTAGSLRVPENVSISYSTIIPRIVTFAGPVEHMVELVAILRSTADEMEVRLALLRCDEEVA